MGMRVALVDGPLRLMAAAETRAPGAALITQEAPEGAPSPPKQAAGARVPVRALVTPAGALGIAIVGGAPGTTRRVALPDWARTPEGGLAMATQAGLDQGASRPQVVRKEIQLRAKEFLTDPARTPAAASAPLWQYRRKRCPSM